MSKRLTPSAVMIAAMPLLLAGCGDSDVQEVRAWMKLTDSQAHVAVTPISEPKTFIPFAYASADAIDPFNPNKLLAELARAARASGKGLKPDLDRPKEQLESFPLDTIKMVGSLQKAGQIFAQIQVDRSYYQVKAGQHIGQNFGLITSVTENAINIKEIVQDASGDWVERMSKLELQESKETTK